MDDANWFIGWPADAWSDPEALDASVRRLQLPESSRLMVGTDRHVTLAFLGRCGEQPARRAFDVATTAAAQMPARIRVDGTRWQLLGSARAPSAVSLLVRAQDNLLDTLIHGHRGSLCAAAAVTPDQRPPKPHVTVARLSRKLPRADRERLAGTLSGTGVAALSLTLDQLSLFTWTEQRDQRLFRRVASVPLGRSLQT